MSNLTSCSICWKSEPTVPAYPVYRGYVLAHQHCLESITAIQKEAKKIAGAHWPDKRSVGELIALCHSELSEALEEYRKDGLEKSIRFNANTSAPEGWGIELADAVIRIAHLAEETGVDLAASVWLKMEYNRKRPVKHGGKLI